MLQGLIGQLRTITSGSLAMGRKRTRVLARGPQFAILLRISGSFISTQTISSVHVGAGAKSARQGLL